MQGNGAEMTRIAACAVIDAGIQIDAIVHDALLIEGKIEDMPDIIALVQNIMSDVSQEMLDVIRVRTEATVYPHPQHFQDPRGIEMWNTVTGSIRRERN
jgi:DNA polymerase-1